MSTLPADPQTYQDIIAFLAEELDLPSQQIGPHTRLREDLALDQERADELLRDFGYAFNVDMMFFRTNDYFGPQPVRNKALATLLWLFGNARPLKTLRVLDLCRAAERGRF